MPGTSLIADYRAGLYADLPRRIADELADGLDQSYQNFRLRGLDEDAAARAAVTEFGDRPLIVAELTAASSGRRIARRLLLTGPGAGLCWGIALITARAWDWPVPVAGRAAFGAALMLAAAMLATAAFGHVYRKVSRAAVAGCLGLACLDATMISLVLAIGEAASWAVRIAMLASMLRIAFALRSIPSAVLG